MAIGQSTKSCNIVLHDDTLSQDDVLCGVNVLPPEYLAYLSATGAKTLCVHAKAPAANKDEISVHVSVARIFGFENRMKGNLTIVEDVETATASHVELLFRDQHLSRADMWRIKAQIDSRVLYQGQKLKYLGSIAASVETIYIAGQEVQSAFIAHPQSRLIFRSGSARFSFLIQVSKEMLEYWGDGDLMYEKLLDGFLPELFGKWDHLKVRHQVSVILFGRQFNLGGSDSHQKIDGNMNDSKHEDFFHVIAADVSSSNWRQLLRKLKRSFNSLTLPQDVSLAATGNMLEAIHLAAMDFAGDNVDPHLANSGASIIAITAGSGFFEAEYGALKRTTQLLMGSSLGVDIVSLSPKPLHPVPLFHYNRNASSEFALPHWMDISYWHTKEDECRSKWLFCGSSTDVNDISIAPLDRVTSDTTITSTVQIANKYDDQVFEHVEFNEVNPESTTSDSTSLKTAVEATDGLYEASNTLLSSGTENDTSLPTMIKKDVGLHESPMAKAPFSRGKRDYLPPHPLMQSSRKISIGPKGMAPSQGQASTTVSAQHAQHEKEGLVTSTTMTSETSSGLAKHIRDSLKRKPSHRSFQSNQVTESIQASKPINIQSTEDKMADDPRDPASLMEKAVLHGGSSVDQESESISATPTNHRPSSLMKPKPMLDPQEASASPWLTLLNPCNPRKDNMRVASEYRQWQNVFPKAVSSGAFKWESMCIPAALPLVTEARVSLADLERYFSKTVRRLVAPDNSAEDHNPSRQVMLQMISIRLSAGFQIVPLRKLHQVQMASEQIQHILLSLGSHYHELRCTSNFEVQVGEYNPATEATSYSDTTSDGLMSPYRSRVESTIAYKERSVNINFEQSRSVSDWSPIDDQCVNMTALSSSTGRFQMRLVLIPVEPSRVETQGVGNAPGLADEERRLDGIQKLTQMWQRYRYFTEEDQKHQASMAKSKLSSPIDRDPNPLAIEYQTRDPSAVVNAYGTNLANQLTTVEGAAKLFAESETYHSSNFDIAKLVKHIQEPPPNGIELRDRRWFTRLHLKCFRGDEMTNWLLRVFKDLQTREDAVALGNQLMDQDTFTHVRGKHEFRDGHYFYQIKSAYRTTDYPDTAGFFGKAIGRSVPSTPITEQRPSPSIRPVQGDSDSSDKGTPTKSLAPVDRQEKKEVLLSEKMQYNVDSGKRSGQLEIVNLHYDRIHNPDNCYHIQLDWTATTPKLIRESVVRWTGLVESHGLRLVQLPLQEAYRVQEGHPFDQVLPVKLSLRPPDRLLATPQLDANSFSPRLTEDPDGYHKALLRKAGFALDLEAAHTFPRNIDVKYSWGSPDYKLTQFVHKSGLLLAQVSNDEKADFLLLPNRLAQQSLIGTSRKPDPTTVEDIVRNFVSLCHNKTALSEIYEEANKPKVSAPSPFVNAAFASDHDVPPLDLPPHLTHRTALRGIG